MQTSNEFQNEKFNNFKTEFMHGLRNNFAGRV